jgi:hypothetical protein
VLAQNTSVQTVGVNFNNGYQLLNPVFIPAGKGLYFIENVVQTTAFRSCLYTLQ